MDRQVGGTCNVNFSDWQRVHSGCLPAVVNGYGTRCQESGCRGGQAGGESPAEWSPIPRAPGTVTIYRYMHWYSS